MTTEAQRARNARKRAKQRAKLKEAKGLRRVECLNITLAIVPKGLFTDADMDDPVIPEGALMHSLEEHVFRVADLQEWNEWNAVWRSNLLCTCCTKYGKKVDCYEAIVIAIVEGYYYPHE